MILAIDIGNTTVSLGALQPDGKDWQVAFAGRMRTSPTASPKECEAGLRQALAGAPGEGWEGAVMTSVVPALNGAIRQAVQRLTGCLPIQINTGSRTGLTFERVDTSTLGHDRIVDSAWAAAHLPLPAMTVDMGTATTFNVIGVGGEFLGGMIAPGLATSVNALSARAWQLPRLRLVAPTTLIGANTRDCMLSGSMYGAAAMIDGFAQRVEAQLGAPLSVVITGGLAGQVHPLCLYPHRYDPQLLLKGLGLLYTLNTPAEDGR